MIPEIVPLVFIGKDLSSEHPGLYYQDAESFVVVSGTGKYALLSSPTIRRSSFTVGGAQSGKGRSVGSVARRSYRLQATKLVNVATISV